VASLEIWNTIHRAVIAQQTKSINLDNTSFIFVSNTLRFVKFHQYKNLNLLHMMLLNFFFKFPITNFWSVKVDLCQTWIAGCIFGPKDIILWKGLARIITTYQDNLSNILKAPFLPLSFRLKIIKHKKVRKSCLYNVVEIGTVQYNFCCNFAIRIFWGHQL
jgi:hypothetical protein